MKDIEIIREIMDAMSVNRTLSKSGESYFIPEGITPQEVKDTIILRTITYLNDELIEPYGKAKLGKYDITPQEVVEDYVVRFRDIVKKTSRMLFLSFPDDEEIESALQEGLNPRYLQP